MRAWIGVFSLSAIGSTGFAVNELRQLEHHTPMVVRPVEAAPALPPPVVAQVHERPVLSTWHGALPFGGVPVAAPKTDENDEGDTLVDEEPDVDDEGEGVPDVEDRCPDDNSDDDVDGCPEVINGLEEGRQRILIRSQPKVIVTVDGEERRRIILERSEIIIY